MQKKKEFKILLFTCDCMCVDVMPYLERKGSKTLATVGMSSRSWNNDSWHVLTLCGRRRERALNCFYSHLDRKSMFTLERSRKPVPIYDFKTGP